MKHRALLLLLVGGLLTPASAQTRAEPPQTILAGRTGEIKTHLQSGLDCPYFMDGFLRIQEDTYTPDGAAIDCIYSEGRSQITLMMGRANEAQLDAQFASTTQSMLQRKPALRTGAPAPALPSGYRWLSAAYTETTSDLAGYYSGLHTTALPGWIFSLRTNYKPEDEAAVTKLVERLAGIAVKTVATRASACAASTVPERKGQRMLANEKPEAEKLLQRLSISASALARRSIMFPDGATWPVWCIEGSFNVGTTKYFLYRNIAPLGPKGGAVERIARAEYAPGNLVVYVMADKGAPEMVDAADAAKVQAVTNIVLDTANEISLVGIFDGRPALADIVKLAALGGGYMATYSTTIKKGGETTIYRPF